MHILLNGEEKTLPGSVTVTELLEQLGMAHRRVAVEVNREIVPRSRHAEHRLQPGDRVEVVFAVGGG
ncbi:MAG TPA: sulfur carrier protein ThiS [Burkholderiales bacterium]